VIITRDEKPFARLVPYVQERPKRGFGSMRGRAWLDESFWEPLLEEKLKLWEGG
jgi:antitoxin (DNA-binding transcriptional repressor) of toxin-antitoxin stability system